MKISDLELTKQNRIETDTDAYSIISNDYQLRSYIDRYGNVNIILDEHNVYRVQCNAMKARRDKYCIAKAKDIARYGCE